MAQARPGVFRLVFDFPLRWLWVALVAAVFVPLMDGIWLAVPKTTMPLMTTFMFGPVVFTLLAVKLPVWRLLPVSRVQMARAQWWLAVGLPFLALALALLAAWLVVRGLGHLRQSAGQSLFVLELQLAGVLAYFAAGVIGQKLSGQFGVGIAAATMVALIGFFATSSIWSGVISYSPALAIAVAILLAALAAAAYFRREPVVIPVVAKARAAGAAVRREAKPGPRGWAAIAPRLIMITGLFTVGAPAAVLALVRFGPHVPGGSFPIVMGCMSLIFLSTFTGMFTRMSIRALRTVGGDSLNLTFMLQGMLLLMTLAPGAAIYATARVVGPAADTVPAIVAAIIAMGSCFVPIIFRTTTPVGVGVAIGLTTVVQIPIGIIAGLKPSLDPYILGGAVALMILGWAWTWWELSHGRRVYRSWPMSQSLWRGAEG